MDSERLAERLNDYLKALSQLEKAARQPKDEFVRDSVIQRFEFTHELAWKMLRLRLEQEGIVVKTPRETIQEALQAGLITDGNLWTDMQKMRNLTSHPDKEKLAEDVYGFVVGQGLELFQKLAATSKPWQVND